MAFIWAMVMLPRKEFSCLRNSLRLPPSSYMAIIMGLKAFSCWNDSHAPAICFAMLSVKIGFVSMAFVLDVGKSPTSTSEIAAKSGCSFMFRFLGD